ncbi:MAG: hypothetical protein HYV95_16960 [Opitutae bacterium]|nr:hypothetical protein [Opitutae bacterium]
MTRRLVAALAFCGVLCFGLAGGPDRWAQLRRGMSAADTAATLGAPLVRTTGHGFELWIYNSHAEVVFYKGPVMAWTEPVPDPVSDAKPLEQDLPIGPSIRLPPHPAAKRVRPPQAEDIDTRSTHFRRTSRG